MNFSSFKSWISLQAEVTKMIEKRETFSSQSFLETSASREILNGRVLRLWKTEKGSRNDLHMNFCLWWYEIWSRMRDWGSTSYTLIYWISITSWQIDKTTLFPLTNSLCGKEGITYFSYLDFFSALSILVMLIGLTGVQFSLIIRVINKIGRYTFRRS